MKNLTPSKEVQVLLYPSPSPHGKGNMFVFKISKQRVFFILLIASCIALNTNAQVQSFTLTNVADGKLISLDQYSSSSGVVVVFTSNECPFDNYYKDRTKEMIGAYAGKIQFLLVPAQGARQQ